MTVELVNTGSELMLGRVLNSHQQWLCRELSDRGYIVTRQVAVADRAGDIEWAVRDSLSRADLVITTGGLGPTSDDLTRESIARMLGLKLVQDEETLARIKAFFAARGRPLPERVGIQAMVPAGATVLPNLQGTAPGLAIPVKPNPFGRDGGDSWLILLPGPGRELQPMFRETVAPLLRRLFPAIEPFVCRTLRTIELGESVVQEKIAKSLVRLVEAGLEVGYCARPGQVDVRLAARGESAEEWVSQAEQMIRALLGRNVFGTGEEDLEAVVIRLLAERNATLATAESCTGGYIAHCLTNVPGSSAVFRAGWVTYSDAAKQELLGVHTETLTRWGAVSDGVAREMAAGARRAGGTDYAIAVTGIAGPTGGTAEKPIGTVFIALASPRGTAVRHECNDWDRVTFKQVTARQALNQLRLALQTPK